jgi:hypothetical protein
VVTPNGLFQPAAEIAVTVPKRFNVPQPSAAPPISRQLAVAVGVGEAREDRLTLPQNFPQLKLEKHIDASRENARNFVGHLHIIQPF